MAKPRKNKLRIRTDEELDRRLADLTVYTGILDQADVPWWLAGGSCLGGRRSGDFIPWDWDVEIHCRTEDALPVSKPLRRALKAAGFEINTRLTRTVRDGFKVAARRPGGTRIGLLGFVQNGDLRARMWPDGPARSPLGKRGLTIPARFFTDGSTVTIRGTVFRVHHPIDDYLQWCYGPDWRTPQQIARRDEYLTPQMRGME